MSLRMCALALLLVSPALAGCLDGGDGPATDDEPVEPTAEPRVEGGEDAPPKTYETTPERKRSNTTGNETGGDATPTAQAETPATFSLTGIGCAEALLLIPIPADAARALVPSTYTVLLEPTGFAVAIAGLKECDATLIDGAPVGPASTSDVGVLIESPDGTEGFHYYQTWWATDNPVLWARLQGQGWDAPASTDTLTLELEEDLAGFWDFTVETAVGTYTAAGIGAKPPVEPVNDATGWYDGPLGTVSIVKTLTSTSFGGGAGGISAAAGTPMAQLLGGTDADGVALLSRYDMTGTVGLVAS